MNKYIVQFTCDRQPRLICVILHLPFYLTYSGSDLYLFILRSCVHKKVDRPKTILKIHFGIEFEVGTTFVRVR